ncbi:MAG: fumarylacetoacetate hydrolase family protein [Sneathiellaceae bacterium]
MGGQGEPERLAARIADDHAAGRQFAGYAPPGGGDLALAYAAQDAVVRQLQAAGRGRPAGWKIGLTSPRMQSFLGVTHPLAGVILDSRVMQGPAEVSLAGYGRLGLECEIALRIGSDLAPRRTPLGRAEAAALVAGIAPAFELVDDRAAVYEGLDAFSIVADNGWSAGAVLGPELAVWPDLAACTGRFAADGAVIEEGSGGDVLGHPLAALAWLAAHLGTRGQTLPAGSLVMTGSMVRTHFAEPGHSYGFALAAPDGAPMGEVALRVTA